MGESKRKKNGSSVLLPGEANLAQQGRLPHNPNGLRAVDLTDAQIAAVNHVEWLREYARVIMMPTATPMTPQRMGTATRLEWAARYIRMLQLGLRQKDNELAKFRPHPEPEPEPKPEPSAADPAPDLDDPPAEGR